MENIKQLSELNKKEKLELLGCSIDLKADFLGEEIRLPFSLLTHGEELSALGCTFDVDLAAEYGRLCDQNAQNSGEVFGSVLNVGIVRDPMHAKSKYMLGEDVFAVSQMCYAIAENARKELFAKNMLGGENRLERRSIDARALHEIYLRPFYKVANLLAGAVIPNGTLNSSLCYRSWTLMNALKTSLLPSALIVNDFCSLPNISEGAASGACYHIPLLKQETACDALDEKSVDEAVLRLQYFMREKHADIHLSAPCDDYEQRLAKESMVLLKNNGILPFTQGKIGAMGDITDDEFAALSAGLEFCERGISENATVLFLRAKEEELTTEQMAMVGDLIKKCSHVIVVLLSSHLVPLNFTKKVSALVYMPYHKLIAFKELGQMLGGEFSPSGKLNVTYALQRADYPGFRYERAKQRGMFCYESAACGYRYFASFNQPVLYPFGYGLGYTNFNIVRLKLFETVGGLRAEMSVKNASEHDGYGVVFIFACLRAENILGLKERLVGFKRMHLKAGEEKLEVIGVKFEDFSVYDASTEKWKIPNGKYEIYAGLYSGDRQCGGDYKLTSGEKVTLNVHPKTDAAYFSTTGLNPTGMEVEKVMGMPLLAPPIEGEQQLTVSKNAVTLTDMAKTLEKLHGKQDFVLDELSDVEARRLSGVDLSEYIMTDKQRVLRMKAQKKQEAIERKMMLKQLKLDKKNAKRTK